MNWDAHRQYFTHLEDTVYLNHAAVSPMNQRVIEATHRYQAKRAGDNILYWPDMMEDRKRFKALIGQFINAPVTQIARVETTSAALTLLANGLDWQPGDRVLLNNMEFPANVYPFLNLKRFGVEIDFVQHDRGQIHIDDIRRAIRPETKLLAISFVQFSNGFRSDLAALGQLCREHDLIFSVDGIQGVGAMQIDVQAMGIDFLANGGQKWLMWPMGTGYFYISPRLIERVYPTNLGWLAVEDAWEKMMDYRLEPLPTAERYEPSGFNVQGLVTALASLEWFVEIGPAAIQERILALGDYLIEQLQADGYELFTVTDPAHRSGIVTFKHPRAMELWEFLQQQRVIVSLRTGMIRVSPHFYNNTDDIDRFMAALRRFG